MVLIYLCRLADNLMGRKTRQQQKQQGAQLSEVFGNLGELGLFFCCCRVAAPVFLISRSDYQINNNLLKKKVAKVKSHYN
jgi:hypothetical protein